MAVEPLAIVGLACRLPGGSNNLESLWELLGNGGEAWSPVPEDRFNEAAFHHPNTDDPNGTNSHRGGHFIDGDVRDFDHAFFHLSPPLAAAMDPQQRILLELAYEALESAGWTREACAKSRTAVYAAIFGFDYERNLGKDVLDLPVYQSVGTGIAILANRISHAFDFRGPSVTVDTGCSGGLVALHHACQSIRSGESDAALVASANLQLMPDQYIGMSAQHMVSSKGRCYPFDIRGEGYGRGEGFAVVLVKRLSHALRDRDPIRSIILNTGVNQDGFTTSGITHPNRDAQADLIRETYARIGLRPQDVVYVEAHGTGTVAGDGEELAAIADVFGTPDRSLPIYVGSNKGSIGHTESTSGLASLLKALCVLEHGVIPPVAGFATPKPGLPLDRIRIPTERLQWPGDVAPRISINSFGYGGTNAHAIIEKGRRMYREISNDNQLSCNRLFIFSANSQASLKAMIESHIRWLELHPEVSLADLSHTLCHGRSALPWRFSCVAESLPSLARELRQGLNKIPSKTIPSTRGIAFVFTGQGAQWAGMGRELLLEAKSSVFSDSIRLSRDILRELGATWDLEFELLRQDGDGDINKAELAQPVTTAIQIALVELLRAQGVRPWAVVGHSSGEIAAAYAAGRLSQTTALRIAFHRGFMATAAKNRGLPRGAMASIGLGERDVSSYLENLRQGRAVVACINSPTSVTISGDVDAIDEVIARVASSKDGTFNRKLHTDTAYHSHHMAAVADEYRTRLGELDPIIEGKCSISDKDTEDEVVFISSVTGLPRSSNFSASYWVDNLVSQVKFSEAVQTLKRAHHNRGGGHALFLEIGPHPALAGPVRQCLTSPGIPSLEYDYFSMLHRGTDALSSALALAGRLFERGMKLEFGEVLHLASESDTAVILPNLPSYAWDHSVKHWHDSRLSREYRLRREPYHDLLGVRIVESTSIEPRWRHMVGLSTLPWLADHVIDGLAIFPGAGYICMALEAVMQLAREQGLELASLVFNDISFLRGLVVPNAPQRIEMQLSLKRQPGGAPLNFSFSVSALTDDTWDEQCNGFVKGILENDSDEAGLGAQLSSLAWQSRVEGNDLDTELLYSEMATDGNTYGPTFRGLRSINMVNDGLTAVAVVEVSDVAAVMPAKHQTMHVLHPTTFDAMFHVGIPMIKQQHGAGSVMPVHIGELLVSAKMSGLSAPGSKLEVSAKITSNQFRATYIDMNVTDGGAPVLSASGIESRSLAAHTQAVDSGTCYELEWQTDLEFLRASDLPETPTLADLVHFICFKDANLSVLELGGGRGELALAFLAATNAHGGTIATYDLADTTSEFFDDARERLNGQPVSYRVFDPESSIESQGFSSAAYDIVLSSNVKLLSQASIFLKPNGVLIIVLKSGMTNDSWLAALTEACPSVQVQFSFLDTVDNDLVVLARNIPAYRSHTPSHIQMLTHSALRETPSWVAALKSGLGARGISISVETLNQSSISSQPNADIRVMVIDDLPQPILSDRNCFDVAITLLRQKAQILWVSLDNPLPMHQITGVARTAHAENDDLRLTSVHVASDTLPNSRLVDVLYDLWGRLTDPSSSLHHEREYAVTESASVLIPRLFRSDKLNRAVKATKQTECMDIQSTSFSDAERPLALSTTIGSNGSDATFVDVKKADLADDAIEIETQAFVLTKSNDQSTPLGEYAGIVRAVGRGVDNFVPGDEVLGLSLDETIGHSRPHIIQSHVIQRPDHLSPAAAAALFLPTQAAIYALQYLARLLPKDGARILIHGVLTDIGRATVAVARTLDAGISATAADPKEAREIVQTLGIQVQNVIIERPSLSRHAYDHDVRCDAIVIATRDPIPAASLALLKPFGHVIFLSSADITSKPKLPRNATVHFCHISELLSARPHLAAKLVKQAEGALQHISTEGIRLVVQDVTNTKEAFRQLNFGISDKVIIQATPSSLVRITVPPQVDNAWANADSAYVVAGGMGDLGQRFLTLLARRGAKHLVTLSRRTIELDEQRALEAQLQCSSPGCRLYCLKCDVTSEREVNNAAKCLVQLGVPPVRGIIQSAVLLQDRTLETMTFNTFIPVTLAKIQGTLNLERAFSTPCLDFFLMLSSAVVVTGASGQANYNAGNAVQDAIAHHGRPGYMSLNIGWIEDAIHTANDKTKLQGLWRTGLTPIPPSELLRYFDYLLGAASVRSPLRQAVIGFDTTSLSHTSAGNSNVQSALFSHVRSFKNTGSASSSTPGTQSFKEIAKNGDHEAAVDYITSAIVGQLTTLISVDASQVNERHGSIIDLGLDSLVAIELRNWITREFDASLQSSEILTDQPVRNLAQKVASRSRLLLVGQDTEGNTDSDTDKSSKDSTSPPTSANSSAGDTSPKLRPLPLPDLEDTLHLFEESRQATDTAEDLHATTQAVRAFLDGTGPELYQQAQKTSPDNIADAYERQVYLERREPLPETGPFTFIHPINAPTHSQASRAAIITTAAMDFARWLAKGEIAPDMLHGEPLSAEGRKWLFYATRRPGPGVDHMERYAPNHTIAVLRHGHVFQLHLPSSHEPLDPSAVYAAYIKILQESGEVLPSICSLTADERDSWAQHRQELENDPENAATLSCIDTAAFVVCLDDESPANPGERYTQFLLNGVSRPFANRWLDKTLQLSVTANGLSAETYEHTKLDGLDARALHAHLCRAVLSHPTAQFTDTSSSAQHIAYHFQEHKWNPAPNITKRIEHVWAQCRSYGPLEYQTLEAARLGLTSMRNARSAPNATAHLTVLLALYLVDGEIRPAWEKVTLGAFARGRVEWVQTVSPAARAFITAAAADDHDRAAVRALLDKATAAHSRSITTASRGHGVVGPLYALRAAAQERHGAQLPELFHTNAWDATRRGGPRQDIKIGFMRFAPANNEDSNAGSVQPGEAGFLVNGDRGVYVHCNVEEGYARFAISGKPAYVKAVHEALGRAACIVERVMENGVNGS
ncbi:polyketide synthase [Nemania sp. FL0916]|nr:polyketide synthase [Nemania sp. FL0916]